MGSVNKCIFVGNLGRDAELRYTNGGDAVATFSIACTEQWKDKSGQKQERTEWVRVNLWGKVAEALSPYLKKGKQVYVEGKLQTREWEKDGVKRHTTEVRSDHIVLLSSPAAGGTHRATDDDAHDEARAPQGRQSQRQDDDSDIPF